MKSRKPGSIEKAKGSRTAALQDEKHKAVLLPCFALVLMMWVQWEGKKAEGIRKNCVCLRAICLRASKRA